MSSQRKIRLAILECDTPLPNTKAKYGGYGGVFQDLLRRGEASLRQKEQEEGVSGLDFELGMKVFHVVDDEDEEGGKREVEYPDLEDVDGVLLTGSRHDSFLSSPWILTLVQYTSVALAHPTVRVIGVCFGHQIVGRALGAEVGRNELGWEVAVNQVDLSEVGRGVFGGREKLALHQMHRDILQTLPTTLTISTSPYPSPSLSASPSTSSTPNSTTHENPSQTPSPTTTKPLPIIPLASSPLCQFQSLYTPHKLITVQGHPEFTAEIMTEIIDTRHRMGIFDDAAYEKYKGMVGGEQDGGFVGEVFVRFLLEGR